MQAVSVAGDSSKIQLIQPRRWPSAHLVSLAQRRQSLIWIPKNDKINMEDLQKDIFASYVSETLSRQYLCKKGSAKMFLRLWQTKCQIQGKATEHHNRRVRVRRVFQRDILGPQAHFPGEACRKRDSWKIHKVWRI